MLGGLKKAKYVKQEIRLEPGDGIFLYTDGVTEAHSVRGDMYGEKKLLSFIDENIDNFSRDDLCRNACEAILSDVKSFASGAAQYDDITMMWVQRMQ